MSRLAYQCRRGMLELDWLLQQFLQRQNTKLQPQQEQALLRLLQLEDDVLWSYLIAGERPADHELAELCACIRQP